MVSPGEYLTTVAGQSALADDVFRLTLEAPELAAAARPGQFVMLGCGSGYDPFLRRPLSIHQVQGAAGAVSFLYQVRGRGTEWLSARRRGEALSLLGPLGRGFRYEGNGKRALLVGAGIGVAPLLFLAETLMGLNWTMTILIGARTRNGILCRSDFERFSTVLVSTDDGSAGRRGPVTDLFPVRLQRVPMRRSMPAGRRRCSGRCSGLARKKAYRRRSPWKRGWPAAWGPAWAVPARERVRPGWCGCAARGRYSTLRR